MLDLTSAFRIAGRTQKDVRSKTLKRQRDFVRMDSTIGIVRAAALKRVILRRAKVIRTLTRTLAILSILSALLSITQLEIAVKNKLWGDHLPQYDNQSRRIQNTEPYEVSSQIAWVITLLVRIILTGTTIAMWICLYLFYGEKVEYMKLRKVLPSSATISKTSKLKFFLEMAICAAHPFPGIDFVFPGNVYPVLTLSSVAYARLYLLFRYKHYSQPDHTQVGQLASPIAKVQHGLIFLVKNSLEKTPKLCVAFGFFHLTCSAYILSLTHNLGKAMYPLSAIPRWSMVDAMWLLVISIFTIGYGDMPVNLTAERLVVIITSSVGYVLNTIFISILVKFFALSRSEQQVVEYMTKVQLNHDTEFHNANVIQTAWRHSRSYHASLIWEHTKLQGMYIRRISERLPQEQDFTKAMEDKRRFNRYSQRTIRDNANVTLKGLKVQTSIALKLKEIQDVVHPSDHYAAALQPPSDAPFWSKKLQASAVEIQLKLQKMSHNPCFNMIG